MAVHSLKKQSVRGQKNLTKVSRVPAPIKGIDSRTVLSEGDPKYCIYTYNMLPSEFGMRVRRGYREYCIDLDAGHGNPNNIVGTIIPFGGVDADPSDDRLFAVTNEGIWNVTVLDTPVLVLDFLDVDNGGDTSTAAGYGVYTHFTTDANSELLFYADFANGLFQYSEGTDSWTRTPDFTATGPINPPPSEDIIFITSHKKQLWFFADGATAAWYLPDAAIAGDASEFTFGGKFNHGGGLGGIYSWTIDGGEGVDDYLVVVSRAGDVIPYKGIDPQSDTTWSSKGQYFIGATPRGVRFASEHGGDLLLLSVYGLIGMGDLVVGVDGKDVGALTETQKISFIIRQQMEETRNEEGWDVRFIPSQGAILIAEPEREDGTFRQYFFNTSTRGWGYWRGVPINAFDEWKGEVYFGTKEGKVYIMDANLDNVLLSPPPGPNGTPIDFSMLTTYQDLGEPALFKRAKYVRADFVASVAPTVTTKVLFDFNLNEVTQLDPNLFVGGARWDAELWDQALWTSGVPEGFNTLAGSWGLGRYVAIAMRGNSNTSTTLIGWDLVWDTGAPL